MVAVYLKLLVFVIIVIYSHHYLKLLVFVIIIIYFHHHLKSALDVNARRKFVIWHYVYLYLAAAVTPDDW